MCVCIRKSKLSVNAAAATVATREREIGAHLLSLFGCCDGLS